MPCRLRPFGWTRQRLVDAMPAATLQLDGAAAGGHRAGCDPTAGCGGGWGSQRVDTSVAASRVDISAATLRLYEAEAAATFVREKAAMWWSRMLRERR
jgi:hypothetical protein